MSSTSAVVAEYVPPLPNEIVGGRLYPSCVACCSKDVPCLWEYSTIKARMERRENKVKRCERCAKVNGECLFEWNRTDILEDLGDDFGLTFEYWASEYRKALRRTEKNDQLARDIVSILTRLVVPN